MPIRLCESFRAVFYTPFYLPLALGHYEAEGLDIELVTSEDLNTVAEQLNQGAVDVYWGGPMRIMVSYDKDPDCDLVGFCEAVTRDPFMLIGREPMPGFGMRTLLEVKLGSVSEVPTPWMCLQEDLRRAGLDPEAVDRVADRTMEQNADALRAGEIDVVQLFQPYAESLIAEGFHLWYAAAERGPCTYTTLYATRKTVAAREDELRRMTRAMARSLKWLHTHTAAQVAAALGEYFTHIEAGLLEASIARYKELGVWGETPVLPLEGFDRLRSGLLSGGLVKWAPEYDGCMDMRFAEEAVSAAK